MNQSVLPQLQSVEAALATQESQLTEQLASVRERLSGIRAVMPMFSSDSTTKPATAKDLSTADELEADVPAIEEPSEPTQVKANASKQTAEKKKPPSQETVAQKKTAAKPDGRAATWQKYTRPGVKNESIPDAVQLILETQPENEFKIADVMNALFQEKMPKAQYLKARNRISNVLSGGVRSGDWYKGQRGTYRMTKG